MESLPAMEIYCEIQATQATACCEKKEAVLQEITSDLIYLLILSPPLIMNGSLY